MNLHAKSSLLSLLKSGYGIYGDGWVLRQLADELLAQVEGREDRLFPLTNKGLDEALEWIRLPF